MSGFLYPSHPDSRFKLNVFAFPDSLDRLEKEGGWLAQRKFNGWHSVIHLQDGVSQIWNRHGVPFTKYELTDDMRQALANLPIDPKLEVILNGEFVHGQAKSKITGEQAQKHTFALFDLLYCGKPLLTQGFEERYNLLASLCGNPKTLEPKKRGLLVNKVGESQIWLAEIFRDEFMYRFYEMYEFDKVGNDKYPDIEGLMCKRVNGRLKAGNVQYDVNWMMRVRKTKEKVYLF